MFIVCIAALTQYSFQTQLWIIKTWHHVQNYFLKPQPQLHYLPYFSKENQNSNFSGSFSREELKLTKDQLKMFKKKVHVMFDDDVTEGVLRTATKLTSKLHIF